jgi:hypothetical protein
VRRGWRQAKSHVRREGKEGGGVSSLVVGDGSTGFAGSKRGPKKRGVRRPGDEDEARDGQSVLAEHRHLFVVVGALGCFGDGDP